MRSNIAMSADSPSVTIVNSILAARSQIPATSSVDILTKIQNLRGILDARTLSSARNGGDWRRGAGSSGGGMDSRWRSSRGSMKTSSSTGSLTGANLTPLGGGSGPTTPKTPIYTGPPVGRYQSRFRNTSEALEEKILNRIIRLKLNKFGPTTYSDIRDFLFQILGQESVVTEEDGSIQAEEGHVVVFVN